MTVRGVASTLRRRRTAASALIGVLLVVVTTTGNAGAAVGDSTDAEAAVAAVTVGTEVAVSAARPGNVQLEPAVAWNGSVYFVAWEEVTPFVEGSQIYGARVSASGKVLDPGGILLSSSEPNQNQDVKVAAGNGRFLVVWAEDRGGEDIRGALVSGAGTVVKQWFISAAEDAQVRPDVAWNGAQFFVVWADLVEGEPFDIYGTRVTWSGVVRDCCTEFSHGLPVNASAPGDQVDPAIVAIRTGSGPGLFMITWTDLSDPADPDLRGGRVTNAAVPLDGTGFLVSSASGSQSQSALGTNGGTVLGAWTDERAATRDDVFAARFWPTGNSGNTPTPSPAQGLAVTKAPGNQSLPSVAKRGTGFLVTWTDDRAGNLDIRAARIGPGGANLDPAGLAIAATARAEHDAALATGSSKLLVAYGRDAIAPRYEGRDRVFLRLIGDVA